MAGNVKSIPDKYHSITPYLITKGAAAAIDFYSQAFGAVELFRMPQADGRIGHAELKIGDSIIMLADEYPEMQIVGPQTLGNSPVGILLYVEDVDTVFGRAVSLGASVNKPLTDQFYGDRSGTVINPFGHKWTIATHKEDISEEEMHRRVAALSNK